MRHLALALAIGGLYALGALLTFWYFDTPAGGVVFFPPAGLTVAALLLTPPRTWPLWLTAVAVAEISVDLAHHQTVFMALGFACANVFEPLVGAGTLRLRSRRQHMSPRGFLVGYVVCAAFIGPLVGASVGATVSTIAGSATFWPTLGKWWLGDAVGVIVVATPILAWARREFYSASAGVGEMFVIAGLAIAAIVIPALYWQDSLAYAVLPILMLAALRGGPLGVGISGFAVGFSASWVVATGRAADLLPVGNGSDALVETQLYIAVTLLAALAFAVEVAERIRAEQRSRLLEQERVRAEIGTLQAGATERRRIARETHDIVGHALNVMILSGAAARRVIERDPEKARDLLSTLEHVGRDAFRDLDLALGLADRSHEFAAPRGLLDMDELVARLVDAGMRVDYRVEGTARPLPRLVDGSAYRIVQESLTNVAKHAADAHTNVTIRYARDMLCLEISSSGTALGTARTSRNGRGLAGMRERVAVLGGRMEAGPVEGGYAVIAELPI